jgi:DMSO/TMAO reductase YedYZ heme-binding membrane subunit
MLAAWLKIHFRADWHAVFVSSLLPALWLFYLYESHGLGANPLLLLIPLALTSPHRMVRRLGRNWRRLHRLTYAVAVLGLLHFWWMMKPGLWTPWPETAALSVLLGYRVALLGGWLQRWDGWDGRESQVLDVNIPRITELQNIQSLLADLNVSARGRKTRGVAEVTQRRRHAGVAGSECRNRR